MRLKLNGYLQKKGYRAEVDDRSEKFGYKVREAAKAKIPFAWVIGDKEVENQAVSVRKRKEGDLGQLSLESAIELLE